MFPSVKWASRVHGYGRSLLDPPHGFEEVAYRGQSCVAGGVVSNLGEVLYWIFSCEVNEEEVKNEILSVWVFFSVNQVIPPGIFLQTTEVRRVISDALGCIFPLSDIMGRLKQGRPWRCNPKHLSVLSGRLPALSFRRGRGGDAGQSCSANSVWTMSLFSASKTTILLTVSSEHLLSCSRVHQQQREDNWCRSCDFSVQISCLRLKAASIPLSGIGTAFSGTQGHRALLELIQAVMGRRHHGQTTTQPFNSSHLASYACFWTVG